MKIIFWLIVAFLIVKLFGFAALVVAFVSSVCVLLGVVHLYLKANGHTRGLF